MNQKSLKTILLFAFLMVSCGIMGRLIENSNTTGEPGLGQGLWIISPILLAVIFKFFGKTTWQEWALKPNFSGNMSSYLLSILLYPILTFAVVGIANLLNFNTFTNGFADSIPFIVSSFAVNLVPMFIKNIFEEFAWRGYLTAQVDKLNWQRWQGYILVGVIWAAWHLPFYDNLTKSYTTENMWSVLPRFFLFIISASFIYGELRRRVNSVWIAVLMHTVANAITVPFVLPEILKTTADKMPIASASGDSWLFLLLNIGVAWWLYQQNTEK